MILRTISSLSLRTPPQPLSHASAASHLPDSTHTRLSHPAVWSWQAKSGSSTSSLVAMIPESIVFSLTRRSRWCAWAFCERLAARVAARGSSPCGHPVRPGWDRLNLSVCVRVVFVTRCEA